MIMMARDIPLSSFFFSLIFFNLLGASMSIEKCTTMPACNSSAPFSVSFPFRLPVYQSNVRCRYSSGFNLWCSVYYYNVTYLYISNPGFYNYLSIDTINYSWQTVTVRDPYGCFPQRFLNLDLSSSPFSFSSPYKYNHTYYNCSRSAISGYQSYEATCMSDTKYRIIVLLSEGNSHPLVRDNCAVIKSFVLAPSTLYATPSLSNMAVELYWSEPQCGLCAATGQTCGFQDGSNYLVECQNDTGGRPSPPPPPPPSSRPPPPPTPPPSPRPSPPSSPRPSPGPSKGPSLRPSPPSEAKSGMSAASKTVLAMAFVVPVVMIMIIIAACKIRSNNNRTSEEQESNDPVEPQLIQTHPMTVTTITGSNNGTSSEQQQSNDPLEPQFIKTHPMTVTTITGPSTPPPTEEANLTPICIITSHSAPSIEDANLNPIRMPGEGDVLLEPTVGPCVTPQILEDLCDNSSVITAVITTV